MVSEPDRPRVVLFSQRLGNITDEERRVERHGAVIKGAPLWTLDDIRRYGPDADLIILGAVEPFDAVALEALPNCRAVVRRGVGHDNVDIDAATRLGIVVANVPDASVEEVSDHALALLLSLERRILPLDRAVHSGLWQKDPAAIQSQRAGIRRLSGLTLGIVGIGRIGQAVARKAVSVYGNVVAADPYAKRDLVQSLGAELLSLDDALQRSDHLTLHMPLLPATHHLLDEAAFARARPGQMLVNTARGGLIDEAALIRAIERGIVAGAGLDVTEHEPLTADDPLLDSGVILTGHSALASTTAQAELARRSVDAVIDLLAERPPSSIVNTPVLDSSLLRIPALGRIAGQAGLPRE